jgi:hypothetical protein
MLCGGRIRAHAIESSTSVGITTHRVSRERRRYNGYLFYLVLPRERIRAVFYDQNTEKSKKLLTISLLFCDQKSRY